MEAIFRFSDSDEEQLELAAGLKKTSEHKSIQIYLGLIYRQFIGLSKLAVVAIADPELQNKKKNEFNILHRAAFADMESLFEKRYFKDVPDGLRDDVTNDVNLLLEKKLSNETEKDVKDAVVKVQETAVMDLGKLFSDSNMPYDLAALIRFSRHSLRFVSKAKAGKLVRYLVDLFLDLPSDSGSKLELCKECINWTKSENRTFLRQALESRLISIFYEANKYSEGLGLVSTLLKELKQLDDKQLLVEVQLMESKLYYSLTNLPKARAALTSARTTANGIYVQPKLQAALDMQSGILHAADERDFKTAYSYFYEAFEGYDSINSYKPALDALKYMFMSKIMLNSADEISSLISGRLALKYTGPAIEAMELIAKASKKRSLDDFQATVEKYKEELQDDPIVRTHLDRLYDTFLEQNLSRIIEPYSRVQIQHVAELIKLPQDRIEKKLSQMILDKKLNGILCQGEGILIVYEDMVEDKTYENCLDIIQEMNKVTDQLYVKAKKIK